MKAVFAIALLAVAMLCASALAQEETADSWYKKGQELMENESYQEALSSYDEGLKTDQQNASAWHYRGLALAGMGYGVEANQSLQKAMELLDQSIQEDPKDIEALWLKAEGIDLLGKSEDALEAYGIVADLNSSHALGAMIRESDILAALGRYNQSAQAFGRAMALVPANRSQSQLGFQRQRENTFLFTKAWLINGQIHRVSNGLYNLTSKSFDEIEQINSDFVAALQLKGKAIDANRHGGSLTASSLNWDAYDFNIPKTLALAWPPFLTITRINPTGDEFIEISNDLKETTNLQNWSLKVESSNITLPEHSLLPGKAVRIHLGSGQKNETDLFLNSNLELNDTVGNVSLRDGSGEDVALLNYWTKLDGSIGSSIMAKGNFEYPGPDAENRELLPENTSTSWIEKGLQLYKNESYEEAAAAFDRAIELEPENLNAWLHKSVAMTTLGMKITGGGMNLGAEDREASRMAAFGEAMAANDRAVEIAPENATVWIYRAGNLDQIGSFTINLSLLNESLKAYDRALELDPNNADAWNGKGVALVHLSQYLGDTSRYEEALRYYDRALELDPQTEGVLQNKASILAALGRQNESAKAYAQVIEAANTSAEQASAWHSKGDALMSQGKYREAVDAYNRAVEIDPKDRWTWMMMAFATDQIGWYNRSLEAYNAVLALDADSSSAMYGKADALYELRRFNESLQAFDAALMANPERSSSWKGKGDALKAQNRTDGASSAYEMALNLSETAIRIDANSSDPWIEKGEALRGLGCFDEALLAYEKAIELPPVHFPVWQKKGDLLMDMGRYDEALTTYEKAIEMDLTFPRLWYSKGLALWALDRNSEAEEAFAKANDLGYADTIIAQDNTADSWYRKSQELFNNVSLDESVQALDEALQMDPGNATLWQTKGSILALMDKKDKANSAFQRADQILNQSIKRCPEDVAALMSKARALQGMGKSDEAIKAVDRAIELDPESIEVRLLKAETLILAGRYNESVEVYDQTSEVMPANDTSMLAFILGSKGMSLYDAGRYEEAVIAYDRAIEVSSDQSSDYLLALSNNKGLALLKLGKPQEALDIFNKTAVMAPVHFGDEYAKGLAFKALGRYDEAISAFNKSIERFPDNPLIWKDKGEALKALGRQAEADTAYAKAQKLGYQV